MGVLIESSTSRIKALFPGLNDEDLREILESSSLKELDPGQFLIEQDSKAEAYYYLIKGRLRAVQEKHGKTKILGDVGVGEPVGELAFFTQSTRMASVLAVRKSEVLVISKTGYETIIKHRPHLVAITNKFIIERLRRNELETHKLAAPKNIAVLNLNPDEDLSSWTDDMEAYFDKQSVKLNVYDDGLPKDMEPSDYFESLEENEGINLLVIDETDLEWSRNCCIYSDLIVVASKFDGDQSLTALEKKLDIYQRGVLSKKVYLLLLHEENAEQPKHTEKWLSPRVIDLHIHVRKHHSGDIGRFCRIISNKAVGLVLGGGGAKGFAHIGVVKALLEKEVPIDIIGGTSAGALYGITMAFNDFNMEKIEKICDASVKQKILSNDLSLPVLSIMSGKKLTRFIKRIYGQQGIEDLWTTAFCVSTNFSKAEMAVHERGKLWRRLRASISIPGIFPPVVIDKYLHVDGAVMDNLPIEPMYKFPVSQIYAISLSGVVERKTNYDDAPTSRQVLTSKILGKKKFKIPGIASIMINSLSLSSVQKQKETRSKVSNYLELDLKGVSFLDNKRWRSILNKGYEQTCFWLDNSETEKAKHA